MENTVFASVFFPPLAEGLSEVLTRRGKEIVREETQAYALSLVRAIDRQQRAAHLIHIGKIKGAGVAIDIAKEWLQKPSGPKGLTTLAKKVLRERLGEEHGGEAFSIAAARTLDTLILLRQDPEKFLVQYDKGVEIFKEFMSYVYDRPSLDNLFEESRTLIMMRKASPIFPEKLSFLKVEEKKPETKVVKLLAQPASTEDYLSEVRSSSREPNEKAMSLFSSGIRHLDEDLYPEAVHDFSNSFKLLFSKFAAYNTAIAYSGMEDLFMAKEYFEKALEIDPRFLLGWLGLASCYSILPAYGHPMFKEEIEKKHKKEAINASIKALKLDPSNGLAYAVMGKCQSELGELDKALGSYKEAVRLDPSISLAWLNMGLVAANLGRKEEALDYSLKAASLDPELAQAWCNVGAFSCDLGRYEEAISYLEKAMKLDPSIPEIWLNLGAAYGGLNQKEKAEEFFNRAKKIKEEIPFSVD